MVTSGLQVICNVQQQQQTDGRLPALPDISRLSPELQQQWHVRRNRHLGPITMKPQSQIKAVW